jgi:AcrR family transcriptional regulator
MVNTKQRILDIARDLFARQGYTGTTIADIARELGTTTAALYYHFPSKADILYGLLDEPLAAYLRIIASLERGSPSAAEILGALIDLSADAQGLAAVVDKDPAVLALIDERLPTTSAKMIAGVVAALAGPAAERAAIIRAQAAIAVTKSAAMELDGGPLDAADRAQVLNIALGTLRP